MAAVSQAAQVITFRSNRAMTSCFAAASNGKLEQCKEVARAQVQEVEGPIPNT
jgi:hypothetical protein